MKKMHKHKETIKTAKMKRKLKNQDKLANSYFKVL